MPVIESFESQNLDAYNVESGSKAAWTFDSTNVYDGTYSAGTAGSNYENIISPEGGTGTAALNYYPVRGDTFRWYFRAITAQNSAARIQFCVQGDGTSRASTYSTRVNSRDDVVKITRRINGSEVDLSPVLNPGIVPDIWYESVINFYETDSSDPSGAGNTRIDLTVNEIDDATGDRTEIVNTTGLDDVANYTSGGVGWGLWGSGSAVRRVDYAHVPDTATTAPVSGTVTVDGTSLSGAKITVINDTTGAVQGVATTDINGTYSIDCPVGDTVHVLMEYDDGTNQYNDESKPFIVTQ